MKKIFISLFTVAALLASTSVMAQDNTKKESNKAKTECPNKKEEKACCAEKKDDKACCAEKKEGKACCAEKKEEGKACCAEKKATASAEVKSCGKK